MAFDGPNQAARVRSLHPGVSFEQVQDATGFPLLAADDMGTTQLPTAEQLEIIRRMDPHDIRAKQVKDNPPAVPEAA